MLKDINVMYACLTITMTQVIQCDTRNKSANAVDVPGSTDSAELSPG